MVSFPLFPRQNTVYASSPLIRATCTTHLILPELITQKILVEEDRSSSSLLCSFLSSFVTSSLLGPYINLSSLFSDTLSLRFSLNFSGHVSFPYKTTGKITVLTILIFKFLDSKRENKRFCTER